MIGYFNFSGLRNTPGYKTFYKTAVKSLERDPNRELAFAIVTDALSGESEYGITEFPAARLLLWNESLVEITFRLLRYMKSIFETPEVFKVNIYPTELSCGK